MTAGARNPDPDHEAPPRSRRRRREPDDAPDAIGFSLPMEQAEVDYLLTADFAQVINGKSYIMGAGWDRVNPVAFPVTVKIGVAVGIRVPFLQSNIPHRVTMLLRDASGKELFRVEGDLETGRPPGARGESVLVPIAANGQFTLETPQTLELTANVDGRSSRSLTIKVEPAPSGPALRSR